MFKKVFKILFGSNSDKRNRFRFDVQYVEDLCIKIDSKEYRLREISLEGFSFIDQSDHFKASQELTVQLIFRERVQEIKAVVQNKSTKICGCSITSNKAKYTSMVVDELAPFLVSFSN